LPERRVAHGKKQEYAPSVQRALSFAAGFFSRKDNVSMKKKLEIRVGEALQKKGWKLAVAESCTGGLLGHRITSVPGSSDYFLGGIIAYSNIAKGRLLDVRSSTLANHGAVSRETSLEMARGVCRAMGADVSVSVTGIAGPSGGTTEKPVGLAWIAACSPQGEWSERYIWSGDRAQNKEHSATAALALVLKAIEEVL
jgi:PncC family amidohydrolase